MNYEEEIEEKVYDSPAEVEEDIVALEAAEPKDKRTKLWLEWFLKRNILFNKYNELVLWKAYKIQKLK